MKVTRNGTGQPGRRAKPTARLIKSAQAGKNSSEATARQQCEYE